MPGDCMICWAMFGNGAHDWYDEKYYASSPAADPPGTSNASSRVVRGGSWFFIAGYCRPAYRDRYAPGDRNSNLGFRVAAVQG